MIEFRADPWSAHGAGIWAGDAPLGRVELAHADGVLLASVSVADLRCGLIEVGGILDGLRIEAEARGLHAVQLMTTDILVRFVARQAGLSGPLRGVLSGPVSWLGPHRAGQPSTSDNPRAGHASVALVPQ